MNPNLIVKIKAPDTDGKSSIGTGYPISHEWVITARHVVDFRDRSSAPITLEWSTLLEAVTVMGVELLDNDIALLRCDVPAELGEVTCSPVFKLPPERMGWKSAGYPDVNDCELFDAIGMFGVDLGKAVVSLTLDDTCRLDQWGGMSGAPVFKDNSLCAVIIEHDQRMEKRLTAISIPWLLHNEKLFREIVKPAKQVTAQLHVKVKAEATRILDVQAVLREKLKVALKLDSGAMATDIAAYIVEKQEVGQAIGVLAQISLELDKKKPESLKERWEDYLTDVEQLCGWLLINSVDPDWWLQHEASLQSTAQDSVTRSLSLDTQAYVEVIISRSLLQQARYDLDEYGDPIPASSIHDPMVFDGHTAGASDIQILSEIFKQLRRVDSAPQDIDRLLADIQKTARALSKRQGGKPIYYIVSNTYLEMLKDLACYPKLKEKLAGCVQFICCVQTSLDELSPCREDQSSLLEDLAVILRLKNPKRVAAHV